jgi:hypothetical protein
MYRQGRRVCAPGCEAPGGARQALNGCLSVAVSPPLLGTWGPVCAHVLLERRLYTVSLLSGDLLRAPVDAVPPDLSLPPLAHFKVMWASPPFLGAAAARPRRRIRATWRHRVRVTFPSHFSESLFRRATPKTPGGAASSTRTAAYECAGRAGCRRGRVRASPRRAQAMPWPSPLNPRGGGSGGRLTRRPACARPHMSGPGPQLRDMSGPCGRAAAVSPLSRCGPRSAAARGNVPLCRRARLCQCVPQCRRAPLLCAVAAARTILGSLRSRPGPRPVYRARLEQVSRPDPRAAGRLL